MIGFSIVVLVVYWLLQMIANWILQFAGKTRSAESQSDRDAHDATRSNRSQGARHTS